VQTWRYVRPEASEAASGILLSIGRVVTAHGVRGEMRIEPLSDNPARFRTLKMVLLRGEERVVVSTRPHGTMVLLKLEGIDTPEQVRLFRGEYLQIRAESAAPLPKGVYYHHQLIGLRAVTTDGQDLGEIVEILALEPNDVYVVTGARGEVLIPALKDVVTEINLERSQVTVAPVPGLLPWEHNAQ